MNPVLWIFLGDLIVVVAVVYVLLKKPVSPDAATRRLHFASVILTAVFLVFVTAMAMYYWSLEGAGTDAAVGRDIFEKCMNILPPIVTLVAGFYFGSRDSAPPTPPKPGP